MKTKLALLMVLVLGLSACHHAPLSDKEEKAKAKQEGAGFPDSSQQLSKWVRTNVADFWAYEKANPSLMAPFSQEVGVVMGDTHLANFAPEPFTMTDGTVKMQYLDIDFDDAGEAPFALDFLRLVTTSKATKKDVKVKAMVQAYLKGLLGQPMDVPTDLQQYLSMTPDQYRKASSDDLVKKVDDHGFIFKPGKIEPYNGPLTVSSVAALFPGYQVIALAKRPVENGESNGDERIWIYAHDSSGLRRLFELKQYEGTKLTAWGPQKPAAEWADMVRSAFWPDVARGEYELRQVGGNGLYWVREKKLTLIDIPYSNSDKKAVSLVRALAAYDSWVLGGLHARQATAAPYVARLRSPIEQGAFQATLKLAAKAYLHDVAQRF